MTRLVDAEGKLSLPPEFQPGEVVEVEMQGPGKLVVRKQLPTPLPVRLVEREDGSTVIVGLPRIDSADVQRLLSDFP